MYLIKPLWDVLDPMETPDSKAQFDGSRKSISSRFRNILAATGDQHFVLYEFFFSVSLSYSPSSCLSFSSFIWLKTRGPYVIKKNPANKKERFDEKKGIEEKKGYII